MLYSFLGLRVSSSAGNDARKHGLNYLACAHRTLSTTKPALARPTNRAGRFDSNSKKSYTQTLNDTIQKYAEETKEFKRINVPPRNANKRRQDLRAASAPDGDKQDDYRGLGQILPRRLFKKLIRDNCGVIPSMAECIKKAEKLYAPKKDRVPLSKKVVSTAHKDINAVFENDLRVDNPRLVMLTYLWHLTATFVTEDTVDEKIKRSMNIEDPGSNGLEYLTGPMRLQQVSQFGNVESPLVTVPFDSQDFGSVDRCFKVGADADRVAKELENGDASENMLTRETVLQDTADGTVFGLPGIEQIIAFAQKSKKDQRKTLEE